MLAKCSYYRDFVTFHVTLRKSIPGIRSLEIIDLMYVIGIVFFPFFSSHSLFVFIVSKPKVISRSNPLGYNIPMTKI